jgi:hypothetical protein
MNRAHPFQQQKAEKQVLLQQCEKYGTSHTCAFGRAVPYIVMLQVTSTL